MKTILPKKEKLGKKQHHWQNNIWIAAENFGLLLQKRNFLEEVCPVNMHCKKEL